jgi:hypothetical protein
MAKSHVSFGRESVNAHPANLDVFIGVLNDFLHLRPFLSDLGVTEHTFLDRRDARGVANVGANVAVDTLHSKLHVRVVGESDGLPGQKGDGAGGHQPQASYAVLSRSPDRLTMKQYCISSTATGGF